MNYPKKNLKVFFKVFSSVLVWGDHELPMELIAPTMGQKLVLGE